MNKTAIAAATGLVLLGFGMAFTTPAMADLADEIVGYDYLVNRLAGVTLQVNMTTLTASTDIYVNETGDSMTGDLNMTYNGITNVGILDAGNISGNISCTDIWNGTDTDFCTDAAGTDTYNTTEEMQDAVGAMAGMGLSYDDANANLTFDCSSVLIAANDHLSCSGEAIKVDDDFVLNTGDIVANYLNVSGPMNSTANVTADYFLGKVSCQSIYGSPDSDFCTDADSGGSGNTTEEMQDAAWSVLGGVQAGMSVAYDDAANAVKFSSAGNTTAQIWSVVDNSTFVYRNNWSTIDDYPAGCNAGEAVTSLSDALMCQSFQTGSELYNTTEEMQDAAGAMAASGDGTNMTYNDGGNTLYVDIMPCYATEILKYDGANWLCSADGLGPGNTSEEMQDAVGGIFGMGLIYDDANNNMTFDCSSVLIAANDHLSCSGEAIKVDDDFTLNTGDTVSNYLNVTGPINSTANVTADGIRLNTNVRIYLGKDDNSSIHFNGTALIIEG